VKRYLILLTVLFSSVIYGQQSGEGFEAEKDQLTANKIKLQNEIAELKIQIDSLNSYIPELEQKLTTAQRELYILKYGEEIGNKIANKQIWTGMTNEMVMESWGEPDRIDKNVEAWGTFTQWNYGDVTFFFKDGKLTVWEGEKEKASD
jgi:hypothetical protein